MRVGVLSLEILIPGSSSLKEKRFVLRSLKDRIRKKFNVSVAEVGYQDKWQRSQIAIALVSGDGKHIDRSFSLLLNFIETDSHIQIIHYDTHRF